MSSNELAIAAQDLGKCYHIYTTPRDRLKQFVNSKFAALFRKQPKKLYREFWALNQASFKVKKGESFGILGRNGAGKSTLLQILCGTLTPTSGSIEIRGRVAALLELGAGFSPEFSGRENIYLNASVLGLTAIEISERFDSICAFADIGDFIEQPVKTYSSGMFVRLAFAIAIHVEPDILIIDEALSVGDIAFQNKCILKIRELRNRGTTLLFVTHDLSTLQLICDRVAWISNGRIVKIGSPIEVCQEYYADSLGIHNDLLINTPAISQKQTDMAKFVGASHLMSSSGVSTVYQVGTPLELRFSVLAKVPLGRTVFTVSIFRADGDWSIGQTSLEANVFWEPKAAGQLHNGRLVLAPLCLAPGDYLIALGANSEDLSICYALTDLGLPFSVRWSFPTWGKFIHPCTWIPAP